MTISNLLDQIISSAMQKAGAPENAPAVIKPSGRPEFGDYQANGIMGAAKQLKMNPRELATKVVDALEIDEMAEKIEIAGPGFINIHLKNAWLAKQIISNLRKDNCGVEKTAEPETIVVDYSGPNLAKEMHVGHLRSTIIGDATARILDFQGHKVIRQNHVGDWGTQFGMLIAHMVSQNNDDLTLKLSDLETFYREAKIRFDEDADFAETARNYVVKLQTGDAECLALWQQFINTSLQHCEEVYETLNVLLTRDDVKPESSYNDDLPNVISDLDKAGLLTEDAGAQCVFLDEFKGKDDKLLPAIVQKSDGGYLYATTDLAALRYRAKELDASRIIYFVDARQNLHLNQVFTISKKAGFVPESTALEHMPFGTMMDKSGKPFKTRAGGTTKLVELLHEAQQRAYELVSEKNPELDNDERQNIGKVIGISAVKYADLSKNRTSDYIFNWDNMLSFEGNTAPYMLYAYARIQSIFRKAGDVDTNATLNIEEPTEHQLALKLLQFADIIDTVAADGTPNSLCNYLYELAGNFMSFYEACPILKGDDATKNSRLQLAQMTANTLQQGLNLLGIDTLERM
ncbi:MAG: Arginyl-tRNA synthetase (EC [uncultured Thiotrichaceae bacterium]|uniref:Arginine--tRNA ligase n=1 Tax=uncultured Thiotrichaceae bacterium TaxID=298394 RepID=A0A6S6TT25_9GAMM|nr:MAG: Arginyl-tRNA synthetase (EC [uncultured Thiotrichaceae bacterium]